jgi:hypothetical protein
MIKFLDILTEVVDLYKPSELESKGITLNINNDNARRFAANLKYKDQHYSIRILPIFNPKTPAIVFGSTDSNYENLNLNQLLNSNYSSRILAAIFGLIRYWIDKHSIEEFEYNAEGPVRNKIYNYYLTKHFPDFQDITTTDVDALSGADKVETHVWIKK